MKDVSVCEITSSEIAKRNEKLNLDVIFSEAKAMPGTSKMHFFKLVNDEVVTYVLSRDNQQETSKEDEASQSRGE